MFEKLKTAVDGTKTLIGGAIFFVLYGLRGVNLIDDATFNLGAELAFVVTGVGLAHKAYKAR